MALKDNYITITQAAKQLGVTRQTISRWIAKAYVSGEKIGRETLIEKKELYKYHLMKLSEAAADSIMALYTAAVADIFREEGLMKPHFRVEFAEDGDENIIHLSDEEKAEVKRRIKPMLEEILKELGSKIKDDLPKDKQRITKQRRRKSK